jgi:glutamate carboxypeptidase
MLKEIIDYVDSRHEDIIGCLKSLIDEKAGSENSAAVNRVGEIFCREFSELGFDHSKITGNSPFGDHLLFSNHDQEQSVVLAGHMDTTFTSYEHLPEFHIEGDRCIGPGTGDMLGGLVVFLYAAKCLQSIGKLDSLPLTIFINSDEERGSPTSRPIFEDLAEKASHVMISESGGSKNEIVIGRRGKLSFDIHVSGVEGHAGNLVGTKASAVEEIAHKILAIEGLNSRWEGTDLNAGKVRGGIAGNTVAQNAILSSDIRYSYSAHEAEIRQAIDGIVAEKNVAACESKLAITSERPLWEASKNSDAQKYLVKQVEEAASELNQPFGTEIRKGTSDANFFGSAGVSVIDGMGPIGFLDHSEKEYILLDSLFERIKLCTLVLLKLQKS